MIQKCKFFTNEDYDFLEEELHNLHIQFLDDSLSYEDKCLLSSQISIMIRRSYKNILFGLNEEILEKFLKFGREQLKDFNITKKGAEYISKMIFNKSCGSQFMVNFCTNKNQEVKLMKFVKYTYPKFELKNRDYLNNFKKIYLDLREDIKNFNIGIRIKIRGR